MKSELPIPEDALRDHMAVLAKTGAGKTSKAKLIVEHIATPGWQHLPQGARVCILDPIKSDYWGLTSSRDGKKPGLPFQILGGPHGHVPLNSQSGKVIGELVASGALRLSILDMADFEPGGLQRFFSAFADTLFRKNKGILYLVVEEAHEFAPKERSGMGNENLSIHHFKKLATGTRTKGIRLIVCTQRTQGLHNAVLGSCETIVAGRFTAPADQAPVLDWFKANVSKEKFAEIKESMSNLKNPESWVACGEANFLERVQFPRIATFDNTATPEHGAETIDVRTAPVDRDKLRQMIGLAAEEAEANDPVKLKARVADLTAQLAAGAPAATQADAEALAREYARGETDGYATGKAHGIENGIAMAESAIEPLYDAVGDVYSACQKASDKGQEVQVQLKALRDAPIPARLVPHIQAREVALPAPQPTMTPSVKSDPPPKAKGNVDQRVIDALAELESMHVTEAPREIVAFLCNYSNIQSPGFRTAIATLLAAAHIESSPGAIRLTDAGRARANKPPRRTAAEIQQRIVQLLGGATAKVLGHLLKIHPATVSRENLAAAAGYTNIQSPGFRDALSKLKTLGFIDFPSAGQVKAAPVLFLGGAK